MDSNERTSGERSNTERHPAGHGPSMADDPGYESDFEKEDVVKETGRPGEEGPIPPSTTPSEARPQAAENRPPPLTVTFAGSPQARDARQDSMAVRDVPAGAPLTTASIVAVRELEGPEHEVSGQPEQARIDAWLDRAVVAETPRVQDSTNRESGEGVAGPSRLALAIEEVPSESPSSDYENPKEALWWKLHNQKPTQPDPDPDKAEKRKRQRRRSLTIPTSPTDALAIRDVPIPPDGFEDSEEEREYEERRRQTRLSIRTRQGSLSMQVRFDRSALTEDNAGEGPSQDNNRSAYVSILRHIPPILGLLQAVESRLPNRANSRLPPLRRVPGSAIGLVRSMLRRLGMTGALEVVLVFSIMAFLVPLMITFALGAMCLEMLLQRWRFLPNDHHNDRASELSSSSDELRARSVQDSNLNETQPLSLLEEGEDEAEVPTNLVDDEEPMPKVTRDPSPPPPPPPSAGGRISYSLDFGAMKSAVPAPKKSPREPSPFPRTATSMDIERDTSEPEAPSSPPQQSPPLSPLSEKPNGSSPRTPEEIRATLSSPLKYKDMGRQHQRVSGSIARSLSGKDVKPPRPIPKSPSRSPPDLNRRPGSHSSGSSSTLSSPKTLTARIFGRKNKPSPTPQARTGQQAAGSNAAGSQSSQKYGSWSPMRFVSAFRSSVDEMGPELQSAPSPLFGTNVRTRSASVPRRASGTLPKPARARDASNPPPRSRTPIGMAPEGEAAYTPTRSSSKQAGRPSEGRISPLDLEKVKEEFTPNKSLKKRKKRSLAFLAREHGREIDSFGIDHSYSSGEEDEGEILVQGPAGSTGKGKRPAEENNHPRNDSTSVPKSNEGPFFRDQLPNIIALPTSMPAEPDPTKHLAGTLLSNLFLPHVPKSLREEPPSEFLEAMSAAYATNDQYRHSVTTLNEEAYLSTIRFSVIKPHPGNFVSEDLSEAITAAPRHQQFVIFDEIHSWGLHFLNDRLQHRLEVKQAKQRGDVPS
ncbi:hypothetical protein LTR37_004998 [Vermiconidia calcicola]|uniref:Uncharacterized protein n=1 Tax=Vermiconidia calcicola TaxID=1690605 RepID=A0ACC3NKL8_9PEZI|nr:hypothetical protein LTR37_004998 [Vermiconidia calcicola]